MAEGVAAASGTVVDDGVFDDKENPPSAEECARLGWDKGATWDRKNQRWKAKVRGPKLASSLYGRKGARDDRAGDGGPDPDSARGDGAGPGAEGGEAGDVQADPDPGWMRESRPIETFKLSDEDRAEIKALIALAYLPVGETLPLIDPYCFGPLADSDTADDIIGSVSDIVCASPRVAKWAASVTGLRPWIKLAYALKPVVVNAVKHHITKSVEVEVDRESKSYIVSRRDWSEYSAA